MLQKFVSPDEAKMVGTLGILVSPEIAGLANDYALAIREGFLPLDVAAEKMATTLVSGETGTECSCGQTHGQETVEATEMLVSLTAVFLGAVEFDRTHDDDAAVAAANSFVDNVEFMRLAKLAEL